MKSASRQNCSSDDLAEWIVPWAFLSSNPEVVWMIVWGARFAETEASLNHSGMVIVLGQRMSQSLRDFD
jgi:hypothetical protein